MDWQDKVFLREFFLPQIGILARVGDRHALFCPAMARGAGQPNAAGGGVPKEKEWP